MSSGCSGRDFPVSWNSGWGSCSAQNGKRKDLGEEEWTLKTLFMIAGEGHTSKAAVSCLVLE